LRRRAEFGYVLLALAYPTATGVPQYVYEDFRRVLDSNPCPARTGEGEDD